jgi:hypothetical protein
MHPTKPEEFGYGKEAREIKFIGGSFQKDHKHNIAFDLILYNDGLIVDTRSSTDECDRILDDILTWIATQIDIVPYHEVLRSKLYVSELYVQTNKSLNSLNHKLAGFAKKLTSMIVGYEHHPIAFETAGLLFWTDPSIGNPPGPFRFERVLDVPFNTNRYYSAAPLQTDAHLKILGELEKILSS